jgi:hypothetical protein
MSTVAKTSPIVVRVPAELGLTEREVSALQTRWEADLAKAAANSGAKIRFNIKIQIEISND